MSSGKLIMLNFKQFLGWLYYIYCVGTPCSYSILPICGGGEGKALLGVLNGEPGYCQVGYTCAYAAGKTVI